MDDPKAIELVERIDHPFQERFGKGELAAWQGLRVRAFDNEIRRFITAHPDATVVALGEGLETQFWRVDNGRIRWVTVDLPESVALRRQLLPPGERERLIAASALDTAAWSDTKPGLITAQGPPMYLDRDAIHALFRAMPPAAVLFDLVSKRPAARSAKPRKSATRRRLDLRGRPGRARRAAGRHLQRVPIRTAGAPSPASWSRS